MSERDVAVIYGNCQAQFLHALVSRVPSLTSRLRFILVTNNAEPGQEIPPIPDDAERAVLYWEQYDQRSTVELRDRLRVRLPAGCTAVRYPAVGMNAFWPFFTRDKRNRPEPGYPWGRYPLGDRAAIEVAALGLEGERAFERYMEISRRKMPDVPKLLEFERTIFAQRDAACDVTMGDYVFANLQSSYQFWTRGHLAISVVAELLERLLERSRDAIGVIDETVRDEFKTAYSQFPGQGELQHPIHPLVIERLGLTFAGPDTKYRWFTNSWTFREHITRYIEFDRDW